MNHFLFLSQKTISELSLSRPIYNFSTFPFSSQNQSQNFPFHVPGSPRLRSLERCTSGRRCHPCPTQQPPSASPGGCNLKSPFVLGRTPNIDTIEALNFLTYLDPLCPQIGSVWGHPAWQAEGCDALPPQYRLRHSCLHSPAGAVCAQ